MADEGYAADVKHEINGDGAQPPAGQDVCRDFMKNICDRGSRCKFFHPPNVNPVAEPEDYHFCADFQNRGCSRQGCRFIHAPRREVEDYRNSGKMTIELARAIGAVRRYDHIGGVPVCKEFSKGNCMRGQANCRFWHINFEIEKQRRARGLPPTPDSRRRGPPGPPDLYDMPMKRGRYDDDPEKEDLRNEIANLRDELRQEKKRYEELFTLYKRTAAAAIPDTRMSGQQGGQRFGDWNNGGGSW